MTQTAAPATETLPRATVDAIREWFQTDPSAMTMMAARQFAVPEQAVLEALVGQLPIVRLRDGSFPDVMDGLPELGLMRVFVRSKAAVMETVGTFGGYSETGLFFNVQTDSLDMHILRGEIRTVYAVEKIGHDSEIRTYSFQFFDRAGDSAFKAFLWENFPQVPEPRIASFRALRQRLSASG